MHEVFQIKDQGHYFLRHKRDFVIPTVKLVNYGFESIRFLGPKSLESLPNNLKNKESIESFKMAIEKRNHQDHPFVVSVTHTCKNIGYL